MEVRKIQVDSADQTPPTNDIATKVSRDNREHTSRGHIFDLVNSIANDLATVNHLTEALYGVESLLSDAEGDERDDLLNTKYNYSKLLENALELRRAKMVMLKESAIDHDPKMWCPLKHSIEGYMEAMEVYQADKTPRSYKLMVDSMSLMSGVLSLFLGMELENCMRCLADALKEN